MKRRPATISQAAFLLNPGCLRSISFSPRTLWYTLMPVISPGRKNVVRFLDKVVFCKPEHALSPEAEELLVAYEILALRRYKDRTRKPYGMGRELQDVRIPAYLIVGDRDALFPYRKSVENARKHLGKWLQEVVMLEQAGHGIETLDRAMRVVGRIMDENGKTGSPL